MWRWSIAISVVLFLSMQGAAPLPAQDSPPSKRVALVIGNDGNNGGDANPKGLGQLTNPVRDARALAALLKQNGFEETEGYDLDRIALRASSRNSRARPRAPIRRSCSTAAAAWRWLKRMS